MSNVKAIESFLANVDYKKRGTTISSERGTLYSYNQEIARKTEIGILVAKFPRSITTSKHISLLREEVQVVGAVVNVNAITNREIIENLVQIEKDIKGLEGKYKRARLRKELLKAGIEKERAFQREYEKLVGVEVHRIKPSQGVDYIKEMGWAVYRMQELPSGQMIVYVLGTQADGSIMYEIDRMYTLLSEAGSEDEVVLVEQGRRLTNPVKVVVGRLTLTTYRGEWYETVAGKGEKV